MKFNLVPQSYKKLMRVIMLIGIAMESLIVILILALCILDIFDDQKTALIFSVGFLLITTPMLIPGILYGKISQSTVEFSMDQIQIFDSKGIPWRVIPWTSVTNIQIKEVAGFFYGKNLNQISCKYICIFLNGNNAIPNVSFSNLFTEKNFIMVSYCEEIIAELKRIGSLNNLLEYGELEP